MSLHGNWQSGLSQRRSRSLRVFGVENPEHQGIWLDGVTPTGCNRTDELFAVCEIR